MLEDGLTRLGRHKALLSGGHHRTVAGSSQFRCDCTKNVDLLRALARFTALPLDGVDLVVCCPLIRACRLLSGLCSSSCGFASGFLQILPHGNALAAG